MRPNIVQMCRVCRMRKLTMKLLNWWNVIVLVTCKKKSFDAPGYKNIRSRDILLPKKEALAFLDSSDAAKSLRHECCEESSCDYSELEEHAMKRGWAWVDTTMCEVSIREQRSCTCKYPSGSMECAAHYIGTKYCKNPCKYGMFQCGHTRRCIDRSLQCDGFKHCDWWEDEVGCKITDRNTDESIIKRTMLIPGLPKYFGNVYVLGRPVCDGKWSNENAKVVCRTIGHSEATIATAWSHSKFGKTKFKFLMTNVKCNGTENHLGQCYHVIPNYCDEDDMAGVSCIDPETLKLQNGKQKYQGNVYISEHPVCSDGWDIENSNVICKQLFGHGFRSHTAPVTKLHSTYKKFIMTDVHCNGKERNLAECKHNPLGKCPSNRIAQVRCQGCVEKELINVFKNLKFSGTNKEIKEAINNTLKELISKCGHWNCTKKDAPKEYCDVYAFLVECKAYMGNEKDGSVIANLQTRINYGGLLQHSFLTQKFSDVHHQISKLGDKFGKSQKELAEYFRNLAVYDKEKAKVDLRAVHNSLEKVVHNIKQMQLVITDDLENIIKSVFKLIHIDQTSLIMNVASHVITKANPFAWLFGNPLSLGDALLTLQKHVATNVHLLAAFGKALPRMETVAKTVERNTKINRIVFKRIQSTFESTADLKFKTKDSTDFLSAYSEFKPVIGATQLSDYALALKLLIDTSCGILLNPQSVIGFDITLKEAVEGRCPRIRSKIEQLKIMYAGIAATERQILDTFATIARASIAESSAQNMVHVLKTHLQDQLLKNITQWRSLLLLRFHKVTFIQSLCDHIYYMNHGVEDQVCIQMRKNPDNDPAFLINYNSNQDMCSCSTCHIRSDIVSIPVSIKGSNNVEGVIDLVDLYNNTKNNQPSHGSSYFVIPEKQWLADYGWITQDRITEGPFFLKRFDLFLPPSHTSHKYQLSTRLSLMDNKLNGRSFQFQDGLRITSSYFENHDGYCNHGVHHPYNIPYCSMRLRSICVTNQGILHGPLYPLVTANWKIELSSPVKLIIPYSTDVFFLKAKVEICWKSNRNSPQSLNQIQNNSNCCYDKNMHFDQKIDIAATGKNPCKQCPLDSVPRLFGYYCENCPAGYRLSNKPFGCIPCPMGTFKKTTGTGDCIKCPVGKTTKGIGQIKCM